MRKWFKYDVISVEDMNAQTAAQDAFSEHADKMEGYKPDDSYADFDTFFDAHLKKAEAGKFAIFDIFLQKHLTKDRRTLSFASGRSANELAFIHKGFDITCSDLGTPDCVAETKKLFPAYKFKEINALEPEFSDTYGAVISLGLIYNFDPANLKKFFENVHRFLEKDGIFFLDYVSSPVNVWSTLFHDVYLKLEAYAYLVFRTLKDRKRHKVVSTFHGYRYTNQEIEEIAQAVGFVRSDYLEDGYAVDFHRGFLLPKLLKNRVVHSLFSIIGKKMPYVRIGLFQKT